MFPKGKEQTHCHWKLQNRSCHMKKWIANYENKISRITVLAKFQGHNYFLTA